eukprot:Gregarina_sp_Pseudo_9__607@NODE_138_length_4028_cov_93_883680_g118_i2_p3_GENE_NODE_138_length_4028_cov_93_883680_g118_i2NODE_138_length_4028_cov_93_883680_g118_i2_p3_ORF_typecomplete_len152_score15_21Tn7_TnsC_Int/PF11426_8/89Tn7_TnsC_Int/PF11426_8/8_3_NODE_138_length_4028_cov_93_883680_g118_i2131586
MIRSSSNWRLSQSSSASTLSRGDDSGDEAGHDNVYSLTCARSALQAAYNKEDVILDMSHAGDLRFLFGSLASDDYVESECACSLLQDIVDISDWTAQLIVKADGLAHVRGLLSWSGSLPEERAKRLRAIYHKLSTIADFDGFEDFDEKQPC